MERGWKALPQVSRVLYQETYFLPNENYEQWLDRVTSAYTNDEAHKERMKRYIRSYWFHPSTPISANAGTERGLPISCYTKRTDDSKEGIFQSYYESFWLGSKGGGIGTDWSVVREVNAPIGTDGSTSSGVIPFLGVTDRSTLAVSQGGTRRASEAVYLRVDHPEINEFIDIRKPTGDINRRTPNLHHGIAITDEFMEAVIEGKTVQLHSPYTKNGHQATEQVDARSLWTQTLDNRVTLKGEPFMLFIDTVNRLAPEEYKREGIKITTSNLCTEITLRTDNKHSGVCCLASVNLEYWDEWEKELDQFIPDCLDFLDNVIQDFIDKTENLPGFERTRNGAIDERSLGLGMMGFHSFLQKKNVPFESPIAKSYNEKIFKSIYTVGTRHNITCDGVCPMAQRNGTKKRNIHLFAIAPTMSISNLCNLTSSGVEPWAANRFTKRLKQGSFPIRNKYLDKVIKDYAKQNGKDDKWVKEQWDKIVNDLGSVQSLDWMDQIQKDVFKTAFEIDQRYIIEYAAQRQKYICQAQSINLFIKPNAHTQYISDLHILAWKKGLKSLYYLRSYSENKAQTAKNERKQINVSTEALIDVIMEDTCIGCG